MIYSVSDIKSTEKQYIKCLIFLGIFIVLMLAVAITLGLLKYVTEGTLIIIVACIVSVFVYGMYVSPLHRYTNYLNHFKRTPSGVLFCCREMQQVQYACTVLL